MFYRLYREKRIPEAQGLYCRQKFADWAPKHVHETMATLGNFDISKHPQIEDRFDTVKQGDSVMRMPKAMLRSKSL